VCDADAMPVYRVRFEGPSALAVGTATALADADGVDLVSSATSPNARDHTVRVDLDVEGTFDAITDAVEAIRRDLGDGATIAIVEEL
jgi:hypothetical protein